MIYTRFGSQVIILADTGEGWFKVKRVSDSKIREWHISELKADGGIQEIMKAAKNLPESK